MRLLTWNLRHGGGVRIPAIHAALATQMADILVLTEYRTGEVGSRLLADLKATGHRCVAPAGLTPRHNAVLVAARTPSGKFADRA